jgi:hypothetical protein
MPAIKNLMKEILVGGYSDLYPEFPNSDFASLGGNGEFTQITYMFKFCGRITFSE